MLTATFPEHTPIPLITVFFVRKTGRSSNSISLAAQKQSRMKSMTLEIFAGVYRPSPSDTYRGYIRHANGSFETITSRDGQSIINYWGINNIGDTSGNLGAGNDSPFLRDRAGIITPVKSTQGRAVSVNDLRWLLLAELGTEDSTVTESVLVKHDSIEHMRYPLGSFSQTEGYGIFGPGSLVLRTLTGNWLPDTSGFIHDADQDSYPSVVCPGYESTNTMPYAINGNGMITGQLGTRQAFIATPNHLEPRLVISERSVTFAPTRVGQSSSPATLYLTNSGMVPLSIPDVRLIATHSNSYPGNVVNFSLSNNCGNILDVGRTCDLELRFTPQSAATSRFRF
jgi:hypothetical protein